MQLKSPKIRYEVAERLGLTAKDLEQMPPVSPTGIYCNHVAHALKILQQRELIVGRGTGEDRRYQVTEAGRSLLRSGAILEEILEGIDDSAPNSDDDKADLEVAAAVIEQTGESLGQGDDHAYGDRGRRLFDPDAPPPTALSRMRAVDPDDVMDASEKARQDHHALIVDLYRWLVQRGWSGLEWDQSVDLWGVSPEDQRVIFEAKTVADNELTQLRGALAQVFEYRALYGEEDDLLAVVVNQTVSSRRADVLDRLGVALLLVEDGAVSARNEAGRRLLLANRQAESSLVT